MNIQQISVRINEGGTGRRNQPATLFLATSIDPCYVPPTGLAPIMDVNSSQTLSKKRSRSDGEHDNHPGPVATKRRATGTREFQPLFDTPRAQDRLQHLVHLILSHLSNGRHRLAQLASLARPTMPRPLSENA